MDQQLLLIKHQLNIKIPVVFEIFHIQAFWMNKEPF